MIWCKESKNQRIKESNNQRIKYANVNKRKEPGLIGSFQKKNFFAHIICNFDVKCKKDRFFCQC